VGGGDNMNDKLPDVENVRIDARKIIDYALNPDNKSGANKAKVFESALGYNHSNAEKLIAQLDEKISECTAIPGKIDEYGQRFTVDVLIVGVNGKEAVVRTGWILDTGARTPRMATLFVK
jgi:hypothetical protein